MAGLGVSFFLFRFFGKASNPNNIVRIGKWDTEAVFRERVQRLFPKPGQLRETRSATGEGDKQSGHRITVTACVKFIVSDEDRGL